jgi:acyl-CoA thioesterase-1
LNDFILHFASGEAFFSGLLLLLIAVILSLFKAKFIRIYFAGIICIAGLISIAASSTPLPIWIYILLGVVVLAQLFCIESSKLKDKHKVFIRIAVCVVVLFAAGMELPFWFSPPPFELKSKTVFLIGDSLGAGTGFKGENTWAEIIAKKCDLNVVNKSVGGGTAESSIKSLKKINNIGENDLVIIEIGGNDMFRGMTGADFRRDLRELIVEVKKFTGNIIMLEIPLAPFSNGFGKAQRELCAEYNITLIPKKYFSWAVRGEKSTVDGLHFSNYGHEKMAKAVMGHIVVK